MAVISGVLKGPMGDARVGVVIELRAVRTSATVVIQARSQSVTDAAGRYTLSVEPGQYDVMITAAGRQPERVGGIQVMLNSATGTLNDFLTIPGETDLNPEIVATVDRMRADAAASATAAKTSADNVVSAMTNAVSKVVTDDQQVVSKVLFSRPVRLSTGTPESSNFVPSDQGAWVTWNRTAASGGTDFINHRGTGTGGYHFWDTNGTITNNLFTINSDGAFLQRSNGAALNIQHQFRDSNDVQKAALLANAATGEFTIRWLGTTYSIGCRPDGFVSTPKGTIIATALATPDAVVDAVSGFTSAPVNFRGADEASFNNPNNYSIGTWYGFSVLPTTATGLAAGVEQGKPVFFVNARTGTAHALKNIYVGSTAVVKVGDYGLGGTTPVTYSDMTNTGQNTFYNTPANTAGAASNVASAGIIGDYDGGSRWQLGWEQGALKVALATRVRVSAGIWSPWYAMWHAGNTTVDANGFIKKASPIVKLFGTGESELNDQSQGVTTERVSEGVYRISGTLGFNADAEWGGVDGGIEIPTDRNKLPLVWVDYEVDETGDLLIKTFHRVDFTAPKFAQNVKVGYKEGQPIDIPAGRWIDLRVEMPVGDEPEHEPVPENEEVPEVTPEVTELEGDEEQAPGETPSPIKESKE